VRGIVGTYVAPLAWLDPLAGAKAFSIQQWLVQDQASWLFLAFRDDQLASLKPLIACWLDVAICAVLSLPPSDQRRVWFALDELATLGRVQSLTELLTKARKQGGCAIVGLQSVAQLRAAYGRDGAQTLLSCLSTWLALRAPDPETAEYLSLTLGDQEIRRRNVSEIEHGQRSVSEQVTRSRIVLPGELQALPDRQGYLSLVGNYATCPVRIPLPENRPEVTRAFVECSAPVPLTRTAAKPALKLCSPQDTGDRHAVDP
jgi:type IV secretory pathway TraG/TraD family ATPase VirD4